MDAKAGGPLATSIETNISEVAKLRATHQRMRSRQDKFADAMTAFSGSMAFLYFHAIWFFVWIAINLGWVGIKAFDPYPFGLLTMIVSLEAIFLSTIVMISQNRMAEQSEEQASLDLQIDLLAEHEITRLLRLVEGIAKKVGVDCAISPDLEELERDVAPTDLVKEIHRVTDKLEGNPPHNN